VQEVDRAPSRCKAHCPAPPIWRLRPTLTPRRANARRQAKLVGIVGGRLARILALGEQRLGHGKGVGGSGGGVGGAATAAAAIVLSLRQRPSCGSRREHQQRSERERQQAGGPSCSTASSSGPSHFVGLQALAVDVRTTDGLLISGSGNKAGSAGSELRCWHGMHATAELHARWNFKATRKQVALRSAATRPPTSQRHCAPLANARHSAANMQVIPQLSSHIFV